jgi:hypothetical protein
MTPLPCYVTIVLHAINDVLGWLWMGEARLQCPAAVMGTGQERTGAPPTLSQNSKNTTLENLQARAARPLPTPRSRDTFLDDTTLREHRQHVVTLLLARRQRQRKLQLRGGRALLRGGEGAGRRV